jgi:hypothetical protein
MISFHQRVPPDGAAAAVAMPLVWLMRGTPRLR